MADPKPTRHCPTPQGMGAEAGSNAGARGARHGGLAAHLPTGEINALLAFKAMRNVIRDNCPT